MRTCGARGRKVLRPYRCYLRFAGKRLAVIFNSVHEGEIKSRKSIRLPHYDYTQAGGYFVTICTDDKRCIFGVVRNERMELSPLGKIAHQCWLDIPLHFGNVTLDEFVIMPNHVHGILLLSDPPSSENAKQLPRLVGAQNFAPVADEVRGLRVMPKSLGSIVRTYKASVTQIHKRRTPRFTTPIWQRNYHEHVIRNEQDLMAAREYIVNNPKKWHLDKYHVE